MGVKVYIYGLLDPVTMGIRYIGQSENPRERFKKHLRDKSDCEKAEWLRVLKAMNLSPIMVVLDSTDDVNADAKENEWIDRGALLGWELTNTSKTSHLKIAKESWIEPGRNEQSISARRDIDPAVLYEQLKRNLYRPMWVYGELVYLSRTRAGYLAALGFIDSYDGGKFGSHTSEFYFTVRITDLPEYAIMHIFPYKFCNGDISHRSTNLDELEKRVAREYKYEHRTFFAMF